MDFFLMHSMNCSLFFTPLLHASWLTASEKCRLLEYKARLDLALFVSRGCPELRLESDVRNYAPNRKGEDATWAGLFRTVNGLEDDGHAPKLVRALANGEAVCGKFEGKGELGKGFRVRREDWLKMGNMVVDSVVDAPGGAKWVRSTGFDEAWEG